MLLWYWGRRGGGARILYELADAMGQRSDVETVLAVNRNNELLATIQALGLPTRVDAIPGAINLPGPGSLGGFARANHVTVAMQVMGHSLSWPAMWSLRRARIATIDLVHDATAHPGDRSMVYDTSTAMARRLADHLIVQSEHVLAQVRAQRGTQFTPATVVLHGPLYAGTTRPNPVPGRVLFAGRIRTYKGLDLLLEAWPTVRKLHPDATLMIAGEGDFAPYRAALGAATGVSVDNRWLSDDELPALVGSASLVVLPYREASQSGIATIARSFGVPVVATNVGGLREQVRDGMDGRVVAPDPRALADAISAQLGDNAWSAPTGAQRALGGPSWAEVADAVVSIAAELTARPRR